jgi:uncharacterized protein
MKSQTNKTALITGASGGIGKSIAQCFAEDGINIIITARKSAEIDQLAIDWQKTYGVTVTAITAELGKADGAQALFNAIKSRNITRRNRHDDFKYALARRPY